MWPLKSKEISVCRETLEKFILNFDLQFDYNP